MAFPRHLGFLVRVGFRGSRMRPRNGRGTETDGLVELGDRLRSLLLNKVHLGRPEKVLNIRVVLFVAPSVSISRIGEGAGGGDRRSPQRHQVGVRARLEGVSGVVVGLQRSEARGERRRLDDENFGPAAERKEEGPSAAVRPRVGWCRRRARTRIEGDPRTREEPSPVSAGRVRFGGKQKMPAPVFASCSPTESLLCEFHLEPARLQRVSGVLGMQGPNHRPSLPARRRGGIDPRRLERVERWRVEQQPGEEQLGARCIRPSLCPASLPSRHSTSFHAGPPALHRSLSDFPILSVPLSRIPCFSVVPRR